MTSLATQPLPQRWLFVPGDDAARLEAALTSGADAIVVDLEEFTAPEGRALAISRFAEFARRARRLHLWPAVRLNLLEQGGREELAALMQTALGELAGTPAAVFLPAVEQRSQLAALDEALAEQERLHALPAGCLKSIATLESEAGLLNAEALLAPGRDTSRLLGALIGTGDLATDLGLMPDQPAAIITETLKPWRQRLAVACRTHQRLAIDGPWRWQHGLGTDQHWANQQGLHARCVIHPDQLEALYDLMPADSHRLRR
ncbi:aldolase/citrate lyase family protein [Cobetia marina]|uniref:aldolase/citrate lyase family protein n=1 Tax=Cobetia marina TaxID=28258 RepID=UPI003A8CEC03